MFLSGLLSYIWHHYLLIQMDWKMKGVIWNIGPQDGESRKNPSLYCLLCVWSRIIVWDGQPYSCNFYKWMNEWMNGIRIGKRTQTFFETQKIKYTMAHPCMEDSENFPLNISKLLQVSFLPSKMVPTVTCFISEKRIRLGISTMLSWRNLRRSRRGLKETEIGKSPEEKCGWEKVPLMILMSNRSCTLGHTLLNTVILCGESI